MRCYSIVLFVFVLLLLPAVALGQLEVGGGYTHLSGNGGLDGFNGSVGWEYGRRVILVGDGDFVFDTSRVGVFDLSPDTGSIVVKSNLQKYMGGARVRLIGWKPLKSLEQKKLLPFGEFLIGMSRLSQKIEDTNGTISVDEADRAFTWELGGGADYTLNNQWLARGRLDLVRTHFVESGQSRFQFSLGIVRVF
jgi:hypothetical protein